jgi:hypothetical protein
MATIIMIGRPAGLTGKPIKKSRVSFFNLVVYAIIPGISLLWVSFLVFLISSIFR